MSDREYDEMRTRNTQHYRPRTAPRTRPTHSPNPFHLDTKLRVAIVEGSQCLRVANVDVGQCLRLELLFRLPPPPPRERVICVCAMMSESELCDRVIMHRAICPTINATIEGGTKPLPTIRAGAKRLIRHNPGGLFRHPTTQHPPRASALPRFAAPNVAPGRHNSQPSDPQRRANVSSAQPGPQRRLAGGRPSPLADGFAPGSVKIARAVVSRRLDDLFGRRRADRVGRRTPRTRPTSTLTLMSTFRPRPRDVGAGWRRLSALCRASPAFRALCARNALTPQHPFHYPDSWYP